MARLVAEESAAGLVTARDFKNSEASRVHELTDLMQRVCPDRDLLLELATVVEHDGTVHLNTRREVVQLDFFEDDAAVAFPPHTCRQVRNHVVAVQNLDEDLAARLEGLCHV